LSGTDEVLCLGCGEIDSLCTCTLEAKICPVCNDNNYTDELDPCPKCPPRVLSGKEWLVFKSKLRNLNADKKIERIQDELCDGSKSN